jgi:hypothetical protein
MMTTTTTTNFSWPPQQLSIDTDVIINECELMELLPERGSGAELS